MREDRRDPSRYRLRSTLDLVVRVVDRLAAVVERPQPAAHPQGASAFDTRYPALAHPYQRHHLGAVEELRPHTAATALRIGVHAAQLAHHRHLLAATAVDRPLGSGLTGTFLGVALLGALSTPTGEAAGKTFGRGHDSPEVGALKFGASCTATVDLAVPLRQEACPPARTHPTGPTCPEVDRSSGTIVWCRYRSSFTVC